MADFVFTPPAPPSLPITGSDLRFPIHRIFCVGRNYAAHAAEMGHEVDREAPFYFTKSPSACVASGSTIPYPPGTQDCHHEMEFAVAIGAAGVRVPARDAASCIFGYGCALDLTRRDLQAKAKDKRRPWDLGKDFENAAVLAPITPAGAFGPIQNQRIHLSLNGTLRQEARLSDMIHDVPALIADLSQYYHLVPGDLILTGTPAGVGPIQSGDHLTGGVDGLDDISLTIGPPES